MNFAERRNRAEIALNRMLNAATKYELSSEELLLRLYSPSSKRDRDLLIDMKPSIEDLSNFFRPSPRMVKGFIDRTIRRDLLPPSIDEERERKIPRFAAANFAALETLIASIQKVLSEIDTLGFDLSPIQRGDESAEWRNPLMSLDHLGYKEHVQAEPRFKRWSFIHQPTGHVALSIDKYKANWSVYWPSEASGSEALKVLQAGLAREFSSEEEVQLLVIRGDGSKEIEKVSIANLQREDSSLFGAVFLRVDFRRGSFVAELFSPSGNYPLKTGLLMADSDFDIEIITHLLGSLSRQRGDYIFRRLMAARIFGLFTRDTQEREFADA